MFLVETVEGSTEPLDFLLQQHSEGGGFEVFNLTDYVVTLILGTSTGEAIAISGDQVTILGSPTAGKVRFIPTVTQLKSVDSPLRCRFKCDNGAQKVFFPSAEFAQWKINSVI